MTVTVPTSKAPAVKKASLKNSATTTATSNLKLFGVALTNSWIYYHLANDQVAKNDSARADFSYH